MTETKHLAQAQAMIKRIQGRRLSLEERRTIAIELAALLISEARSIETGHARRSQEQLARMMDDEPGRAFSVLLADLLFRSNQSYRVADACIYLLDKFRIPTYLPYLKRLQLAVFKRLGRQIATIMVPLVQREIRRQASEVIVPAERKKLLKHLLKRHREGVRINLNHLGEAILGEEEAQERVRTYKEDLQWPEVEYISIKISTICSQLNLLAWEETLAPLSERLRVLYREAVRHRFIRPDGTSVPKFVNLDMEEYRDLHLTVDLFRRVLDEAEFFHHAAGIVLQSYLPDSYLIQQELTIWAMQRVAAGGAPIKIRLVKGANLANEQVEASLQGWPQAPYTSKEEVDANFKRMLEYGCLREHAESAHIGVASHNLFDIAYAMLLRAEERVEEVVHFEMLEGMADSLRRVIQQISGDMLLYCPVAEKDQFQYALAYLIRRLQENTAPDNFLRHFFDLIPGTKEWRNQAKRFSLSCHAIHEVGHLPRRTQNRRLKPLKTKLEMPFSNEPNTDWSLPQNRKWIVPILQEWHRKGDLHIPISIGGSELFRNDATGHDPSRPGFTLYQYTQAAAAEIDQALAIAKRELLNWQQTSIEARAELLGEAARLFREQRGELIAILVADAGKVVSEADGEISEAIDFLEYYLREAILMNQMQDIHWHPHGTVLVASPWNFPCSIPTGGIAGALLAGNCVIFKPSPETIWTGWKIASLFWQAGVPKEALQFITGDDESIGSKLVKDPRVDLVILTGAAETAKKMLKMRPGLQLLAETGGKNSIIVTAMADRDLAVRDIIQSAFSHSGQKCSACSLLICEREVYFDPHFKQQLRDATASLAVGSAWSLDTRISPLIRPPQSALLRGLTTLEEGEEWLLVPELKSNNPCLFSPGIKWGVTKKSFSYQHELFGPVLSVMCADNLEEAIFLANGTPYGLTAGLHSLDEREHAQWIKGIEAGNCYINRGITGAIVRRQPFGGCKESSFGMGVKAGGPNYMVALMQPEEISSPTERLPLTDPIQLLYQSYAQEESSLWQASLESYQYHWTHTFSRPYDPSMLIGQDNVLRYLPRSSMTLRLQRDDSRLDLLRVIAAAMICGTPLQVSGHPEQLHTLIQADLIPSLTLIQEMEAQFIQRLKRENLAHVRLLRPPSESLKTALAETSAHLHLAKVMANGRIELLHYLRELVLSVDYHRSGYLGIREGELRTPIQ